ncbi:MAG: S4 domain-containing protein, partial [Oscillospiraceae bacterium]|nr:S4 domain-containing protein [Oscillospiraceae bacterium]
EQIDEMDKWEGSQLNRAKEILAYELTALVHGEEEAKKAEASAKALFVSGGGDENMPTTEITADKLDNGEIGILDLLTLCELIPSRGEGRRLIQQGGVTVDDEKVDSIDFKVSEDKLKTGVKIRKGKKIFHKAVLK